MKLMYLFDSEGKCFQVRQLVNEALVADIFQRSLADSYIVTEEIVKIDRARIENGALIDVDPTVTLSAAWAGVKEKRNLLLIACDWTQLPDVPLAAKEAWAAYRQALRDVTGQPDPFNISWPQAPQ